MNRSLAAALRAPISFVSGQHGALTALRHDLHANPELGFEEHRTAALVCERLQQWGVERHAGRRARLVGCQAVVRALGL